MKILILVNTLTSVNQWVYFNHIRFIANSIKWLAKRRIDAFNNQIGQWSQNDLDNIFEDQIFWYTTPRSSIDNARNSAAQQAMNLQCDYLMFIDDDVLVPPDTLEKLLFVDKDIVAGHVVIRGNPFNNMFFKFREGEQSHLDYYNDYPKDVDFFPVDAVGFSCTLIKVSLFKKLYPPFFVTGRLNTEDIYFCMKAKDTFPETSIYVHSKVECSHMLNPIFVDATNKSKLQEFYKEDLSDISRGVAYITKHKAILGIL